MTAQVEKQAETKTVTIPKEYLFGIVQQSLGKRDFSVTDAQILSRLDPDLSISTALITHAAPKEELLFRLIETAEVAMSSGIQVERKSVISPKRTQTELAALKNVLTTYDRMRVRLDPDDQKKLTGDILTLFSLLTVWRPDMTGQKTFPWREAIESALYTQSEVMHRWFSLRMSVLQRAPEDVLKQALADHAEAGGDILETLMQEQSTLSDESTTSPEVIRLARLLPDGNTKIARTIFSWVGQAETYAIKGADAASVDVLRQMEAIATEKWVGLSSSTRRNFLTAELLVRLRELYPEYLGDIDAVSDAQPRMAGLLDEIIGGTSLQAVKNLKTGLVNILKAYPQMKLGVIEKWFPEMAKEAIAEAKPLWKKIFTG